MTTNARARGKIKREEWEKIGERFRRGETLAGIARSYGCTSPAIRYILGRTVNAGSNKPVLRGADHDLDRASGVGPRAVLLGQGDATAGRSAPISPDGNEIWSRINNDIAVFLAAMDALFSQGSERNYESLLKATDRLLWASARTRLEVERVLEERRAKSTRKPSASTATRSRGIAA